MIMGMKKFFCLLLAMMLLLSVTACGSDGGNVDEGGSKNPTVPTTTAPPQDDIVWVLVRESDMGSSRYTRYIYDENGNLVAGEFYDGGEKWGDYKYVTTATENGKIVEESYKHIKDEEFSKSNEYEFDAAGRLIRTQDYSFGEPDGWAYAFTYNEAGQLVEQVATDEGEVQKKLTFVYDGDKLMEGHYWDKNENYGHYIYTYDEKGNPVKVDVDTDYMDEQKYTLEFEVDDKYFYEIRATEECHNVVGGRRLFFFEDEEEYRGVQIKNWGIFHTGWLPLVSFGCIDTSNYFFAVADLRYEPLDVHLAKQAEE
ncbi:MAG: hypothetical protein E7438_03630 [Ruminococcaceae bacterium]|nr:hypothetical protein [Oscillospiraceae bacterium]